MKSNAKDGAIGKVSDDGGACRRNSTAGKRKKFEQHKMEIE